MARARVQAFVRDEAGNKLGGTGYEVRFYQAATSTLATIYPDATSGSTIPNPHYPNGGVSAGLAVATLTTDTTVGVQSAAGLQLGDFITLDNGTSRVELVILGISGLIVTVNKAIGVAFATGNTRVNGRENLGHVAAYCDTATDIEMTVKNLATGIEGPRELFLIKPATSVGTSGYAQITANQGSITAQTDVTGLTLTVTVATGRRIRISACANLSSSVNNDQAAFYLMEGATQLQQANSPLLNANGMEVTAEVVLTPSAGNHTYKLQCARISGTGNITVLGAATYPAFLLVEDIGN